MTRLTREQILSVIAALGFIAVAMVAGLPRIGIPPVVIVGGSGMAGFIMWVRTYLRKPVAPEVILAPFLSPWPRSRST